MEKEPITKLDFFACAAMQAIMAKCDPGTKPDEIAKWAYEDARAMVEESNK